MSDLTALAQKLASLHSGSDQFENGARVIAQGGVPSGMCALIRAIDDTVLERQLEILTGAHIVTVIAAGRRLRGIASVIPPKGKSARIVGEALSREDGKTLALAGEVLGEVLASAPRMTLRSLPAPRFGSSGDLGVAASDLAEIWQIDMDEAPLPPIARFLSANSAALQAYLHTAAGEVLATHGDIAALQTMLDEQLDAFLATRAKLSGHAEGPQLLSFEGALPNGKTVAIAQAEEDTILLVYDPSALGQIHASWKAVFA